MITRLDDVLITEQYWYQDGKGTNHLVFAKSKSVADRYARVMGYAIHMTDKPTRISPVTIHNTNNWYERFLEPETRD